MSKTYRKKPVEIQALQYTGDNFEEIVKFVDTRLVRQGTHLLNNKLIIYTLEGDMEASINDYIIRGVRGEFYPCKPDIFLETYEEVNGRNYS